MRKFVKTVLIVAAIFILAGAAMIFFAGINGLFLADLIFPTGVQGSQLWQALTGRDEADYLQGIMASDAARIETLRLDIGAGDVTVKPGDDFAVLYGGKERNIRVRQEEGELSVSLNESFRLRDWSNPGKFHKNGRLTLVIPEDYLFRDVTIRQGAGRLVVEGLCSSGSVAVSLNAGLLELSGLQADAAELRLDSGVAKINGYQVETGDIRCDCGSVTLSCAASDAEIRGQVQMDLGSVIINGHRQNGSVDAGFGYALAPYTLNVRCDVGVIRLCTAGAP